MMHSFCQRVVHCSLMSAGIRSVGTDTSPAFGYYGTPNLDLTSAVPNSGSSPLPVPAGLLDVTLFYSAAPANSACVNASNTYSSAFLIQVRQLPVYPPSVDRLYIRELPAIKGMLSPSLILLRVSDAAVSAGSLAKSCQSHEHTQNQCMAVHALGKVLVECMQPVLSWNTLLCTCRHPRPHRWQGLWQERRETRP